MKFLAGIVTFNPEIERLRKNIEAVISQVDKLVIVDNGSDNLSILQATFSEVEVIPLHSNKGIAAALNIIGQYAIDNHYNWFLTLDQDTIINDDLMQIYMPYLDLPQVGTLSCLYRDLNQEDLRVYSNKFEEVSCVITSAALMKTSVFEISKRFDEWMFIDMVDYDINFEFQRLGYKVYRVNQIGFIHEIGEAKKINFLGRTAYTSNHSALRKYYRVRNSVYLYKKYGKNATTKSFLIQCRDEFIKIFLYENQKWQKLSAMVRGLIDGLKVKVEKNV